MKLISHASSSKANCYEVTDGKTSILLECGLSIPVLRKKLSYNLSQIDACLVSHSHGDHAKSAQALADASIDVWTSQGTIDALGLTGHRVHAIKAREYLPIGTFNVVAFELVHDAPEPLGFYVYSRLLKESLVFVPDTLYVYCKFPRLDYLLIECNFDQELLDGNEGYKPIRNRVVSNHMSLDTVKEFLQANDLSMCKEIWLLHLSGANSDSEKFKREIEAIVPQHTKIFIAGE